MPMLGSLCITELRSLDFSNPKQNAAGIDEFISGPVLMGKVLVITCHRVIGDSWATQ
jgi:hypothetical protein